MTKWLLLLSLNWTRGLLVRSIHHYRLLVDLDRRRCGAEQEMILVLLLPIGSGRLILSRLRSWCRWLKKLVATQIQALLTDGSRPWIDRWASRRRALKPLLLLINTDCGIPGHSRFDKFHFLQKHKITGMFAYVRKTRWLDKFEISVIVNKSDLPYDLEQEVSALDVSCCQTITVCLQSERQCDCPLWPA